MGARIETAIARRARGGPLAPGALGLCDATARACLDRAGFRADELDLLVHAGLYKERNLAEPAFASLVQEDIGANPGHPPRPGHHGTFSFDVMNGGCGALSALQLVDGFVGRGSARLAVVVAADVDPAPRTSHGFPFPPVGGAALLRHVDGGEGFTRFEQHTFAEHAELFEARVSFAPGRGWLFPMHGHPRLEVREDPRFAGVCTAHAIDVARGFLDRAGLRVADVDLLIAGAYPRRFARDVAIGLGLGPRQLPELDGELSGAHTAGPLAALATAIDGGMFARARNVLFVTAGAGITVAVALYRR
jgi:3-oxoacyl-[acyl-carrier-protein] synthase-3